MNGPFPDPDDLRRAAQWWARLAEVMIDTGRLAGQLGEQIDRDRPDGTGREWADRIQQVRAELGREAVTAAELGARYASRSADAESEPPPGPFTASDPIASAGALPLPGVAGAAGSRQGVRLPGTDAARVHEERGMRIAELPDPPR